MNTWVLVANSSEARLYETRKIGETLKCLKEFDHPESRKKGTTLASDRPGHTQSKGTGHGAMGDPANPKEYEAKRFASELAKKLDKGRATNAYKRLVLVAPPQFYGLLKNHLSENTRAIVVTKIQKDYTALPDRDLPVRLKEHVKPKIL